MLKFNILKGLFCGATILCGLATASAQDLYNHTFDGVANDSTPAVHAFTNGAAGAVLPDLASGLIMYTSSQGGGFSSSSPIDLSSESVFTIEYVVVSNASGIVNNGLNGSFFGLTSSSTSSATDGTALYNNAGSATGLAFGLQVGTGRGEAGVSISADYAFDMTDGNGTFTAIGTGGDFIDDDTDGYTVLVTYEDNMDGTTNVSIATTGLATDIDFTVNESVAYSSFSNAVTPNVSSQGGIIDLESITIAVPGEAPDVLKGDVNLDGGVTFLDINPFIVVLSSNGFQAEADIDCDGDVDFLDIQPFIDILAGN